MGVLSAFPRSLRPAPVVTALTLGALVLSACGGPSLGQSGAGQSGGAVKIGPLLWSSA